jgi:hypothetical protein
MNTTNEKTIDQFPKHSDVGVFLTTLVFVLVGGIITVLWKDRGMFFWLLCLTTTTVPAIHHLRRELVRLRQRVHDLEQQRS